MNPDASKRFDVLGLGCAAVDDLLYAPSYPPADQKIRVGRTARRCGGLTAAALVTAARLGARCAYAGCLGTDEFSGFVARHLTDEGVDIAHAPRLAEARVVHSTVVVGEDTGTRNIFFEDAGMIGAHPLRPAEEVIGNTRVLFIDHLGMPGNLRAARLARSFGVAVVGDFEDETDPLFSEVLALVNHLVVSEAFARRLTGTSGPAKAAQALWLPGRTAVIVTCGANGCWCGSAEPELEARHHPAFAVEAADTTGCGDVFHGAYAASLARGDALDERIRVATAAAALKARDGEIPHRLAVEEFLRASPQAGRPTI